MSANTGYAETLGVAAKIATLTAQAMEHITLGRRDEDQVKRLEKALQLFKENRLGDVLGFLISEEKGVVLGAKFRARRKAFRSDIDLVGEMEVEKAFCDTLSTRLRNSIQGIFLRDLVLRSEQRLAREGVGKLSLAELVEALARKGLTLCMTPVEVEECFGPVDKVRFFLRVERHGEYHKPVECKIVLESKKDGTRYNSANGHFLLPPGEYLVVEPKKEHFVTEANVVSVKLARYYVQSQDDTIYI